MEKAQLLVLVADKNMEYTIRGALERYSSLGIRKIINSTKIIQHPGRDPGVRSTGHQILALERTRYSHALLLLDHEGSGAHGSALDLETELDDRLRCTWGDNGKAIVIEPELEVWMWGSDNALQQTLGRPKDQGIRDWLRQAGFEFSELDKPIRPKEAFNELMMGLQRPRSSSIYEKIAARISMERCSDRAFRRLRDTMRLWFPR